MKCYSGSVLLSRSAISVLRQYFSPLNMNTLTELIVLNKERSYPSSGNVQVQPYVPLESCFAIVYLFKGDKMYHTLLQG